MPLAFALAAAATPSIGAAPEYELVFEDEFFGGALDTSAWSVEIDCLGGGNLERQCYTDAPANVRVVPFAEGDDAGRDHLAGDGYLELRALVDSTRYAEPAALADCTRPEYAETGDPLDGCTWAQNFTSGRVNLHEAVLTPNASRRAGMQYGKVEVRAQLPSGDWLWPAVWMLPVDRRFGVWAASGEIDIVEAAFRPGGEPGTELHHTIHYGASVVAGATQKPRKTTRAWRHPADLSQGFHIYGFEWSETSMVWTLDGTPVFALPGSSDELAEWNGNGSYTNIGRSGDEDQRGGPNEGPFRDWNIPFAATQPYDAPGQPWNEPFYLILNLAVCGAFFDDGVGGPEQAAAPPARPPARTTLIHASHSHYNSNA